MAAAAIREYLALNNWQIEETVKALSEAERGISRLTRKYNGRLRSGRAVRVRWLRAAVANLITETEYFARDSPAAPARVETDIKRGVEQLRRFPSLGRPARVAGPRELVIPSTPLFNSESIPVIHSHPQLFHNATGPTPRPAAVLGHSLPVNIFRANELRVPFRPVIRIVDNFF